MPLIPAQEVDNLLDQQRNANQPTQADPRVLAGIYSQSHQLQMAQALRQRQNGGNAPAMANAPLADHMRQAKAAGTQGTPQAPQQLNFGDQPQQPQNPDAGTMRIQPGNGRDGRAPMTAQDMQRWMGNAVPAYNPQHQHGGQVQTINDNPTGHAGFEVHGLGGEQQQPPADPRVQMVQNYEKLHGQQDPNLRQAAGSMTEKEILAYTTRGETQAETAKAKDAAHTEQVATHKQDQQLHQLQHRQTILAGQGLKEEADALQPQIDQILNPPQEQQAAPPQPPVITDPSQLGQVSAGQTVVHNGRLLRRKS